MRACGKGRELGLHTCPACSAAKTTEGDAGTVEAAVRDGLGRPACREKDLGGDGQHRLGLLREHNTDHTHHAARGRREGALDTRTELSTPTKTPATDVGSRVRERWRCASREGARGRETDGDTTHGRRNSRRKVRSQGRRPPELPRAPSRKVKAEVVARREAKATSGRLRTTWPSCMLPHRAPPLPPPPGSRRGPVNGPLPGASPLPRSLWAGARPVARRATTATAAHRCPLPPPRGAVTGARRWARRRVLRRPRASARPPHLRPLGPAIPLFPVHGEAEATYGRATGGPPSDQVYGASRTTQPQFPLAQWRLSATGCGHRGHTSRLA